MGVGSYSTFGLLSDLYLLHLRFGLTWKVKGWREGSDQDDLDRLRGSVVGWSVGWRMDRFLQQASKQCIKDFLF